MKYIIKTSAPVLVRDTILEGVENKTGEHGSIIETWEMREANSGVKTLVHAVPAWENKGCIMLSHKEHNDELRVVFHYWTKCKEEDKHPNDEYYMLGRFTELLLVHFASCFEKIVIEHER